MKTTHATLSILALSLLAACGSVKTNANGFPVVVGDGPTLSESEYAVSPLDGLEPVEPASLVVNQDGACVPYAQASQIADAQGRHIDYLEKKAIAERGWMRLSTRRSASVNARMHPPEIVHSGELEIAQQLTDRVIDTDGRHWLLISTGYNCSGGPGEYYIDDAFEVFSVDAVPTCERAEYTSCGGWPAPGCGVEPEFETYTYVLVPARAALSERRFRSVDVTLDACVYFEPEDGYSYPP